jgi:hypothetical protein
MGKVVVAGGTGFIGRAIVNAALAAGHEAVVLSRGGEVPGARTVRWDAQTQGPWAAELDGALAVVNLTGATVLQRWTPQAWQEITDSRIVSTRAIGEAVQASSSPPASWVNASAVGYYGDRGAAEVSEASDHAPTRLGKLCRAWEDEVTNAQTPRTARCRLRIGVVLGEGGGLAATLSKLPAIGPLGDGRAYQPWVHLRDVAGLTMLAVRERVDGAMNAVSPNPVTSATMMEAVRKAMGRLPAPALPEFAVRLLCRANRWDTDMLLASCRAVPQTALAFGYSFEFPTVSAAAQDVFGRLPTAWRSARPA